MPLCYWISVVCDAMATGYFWHWSARERWVRALQLGVSGHVLVLIAHLAWYASYDTRVALSGGYLRYWQAVWIVVFAGGLVGLSHGVARWWTERRADPWLFFAPLIGAYATVCFSAVSMSRSVTACALLLGFILLFGRYIPLVRSGAAHGGTWLRRESIFLTLVGIIALVFRLFYATRVMSNPDFLNTGSDGPAYDALAWGLIHAQPDPRWSHIPMFAPGYVRFLALVYWLVGRNYFLVCVVQSIFGVLACWFLYAIAKRLCGDSTARLTVGFGALSFPMIFAAVSIGHQAMDLFWTVLVVWCLVRYLEEPQRLGRWMMGIGLILGGRY